MNAEELRRHYQGLLNEHGDSFEAAQYSSRASQMARYAVLAQIADLRGVSVLDFGCGTGHLAAYLKEQAIDCRYTGVDIVEEFFPYARAKHPAHRFGLWEDFAGESFDYVFVSGVFNNRVDDNDGFFRTWAERLFARARKGLAFNLMSTYVDFQDAGLWYAQPERVFAFMKSLTPYVTLRNDYVVKDIAVPFEFAVYAFKAPLRADA
jgi:SAM-dependent methyltransferase